MSLVKQMQIASLKRKARRAYARMQIPSHLDCGRHLADHITGGQLSAAEREFEDIMTRLRELHPEAPQKS